MDFSVFKVATVTTVATTPLAVSPTVTSPAAIVTTTATTSGEIVIVGVPGETVTSFSATIAAIRIQGEGERRIKSTNYMNIQIRGEVKLGEFIE